jgi:DNA-binding CsgD family transcriptional regulator
LPWLLAQHVMVVLLVVVALFVAHGARNKDAALDMRRRLPTLAASLAGFDVSQLAAQPDSRARVQSLLAAMNPQACLLVEERGGLRVVVAADGSGGQAPQLDEAARAALAGAVSVSRPDSEHLLGWAPVRNPLGQVQALLLVPRDMASSGATFDDVSTTIMTVLILATLLPLGLAWWLRDRFVLPEELLRDLQWATTQAVRRSMAIERPAPASSDSEQMPARSTTPTTTTPDPQDPWNTLTEREREVAMWVGRGHLNREIAEKLFVTEETIKKHLRNIFVKLHIRNRTELALSAVEHGALLGS